MGQLGRSLMVIGGVLVGAGVLLTLAERFGVGRLPGDLVWRRKNATFYFPLATSLVLSVVLSLILSFLFRRK